MIGAWLLLGCALGVSGAADEAAEAPETASWRGTYRCDPPDAIHPDLEITLTGEIHDGSFNGSFQALGFDQDEEIDHEVLGAIQFAPAPEPGPPSQIVVTLSNCINHAYGRYYMRCPYGPIETADWDGAVGLAWEVCLSEEIPGSLVLCDDVQTWWRRCGATFERSG